MATKKVFIACPIGSDDSPERTRSDRLLKHVIYPVIKDLLGVAPEEATVRSDKMGEPGRITTQILRELAEADVVIADLTDTNANVMYEVGIRQALLKPFVLMAQKGQKLPFDLSDLRVVPYQLDLDLVEVAQAELKSHLEKAFNGAVPSFDQLLFAPARSDGGSAGPEATSNGLLAVLEACEVILKEARETKELVGAIGQIALDLKGDKEEQARLRQESASQQMSMFLMNQFFQNPESVEKLMPAFEKLVELGEAQKRIEQQQSRGRRKPR